MKADTVDLSAIFGKPVHYVVPLYQRPYVWTREDQWEPLWQDVRDVAERQMDDTSSNDDIPHFLGAVVLEQTLMPSSKIEARSIVDGQQRLTTLQLLIAAARSIALERGVDDPRQEFEKLLFNEKFLVKQQGDELKVFPTFRDRVPFREAVEDGIVAASGGHRIHEAYRFFRTSIRSWLDESDDAETAKKCLEALSTAIWKRVVVVTIDLDPGDNSQVIFETLNARGTPLLAADLVKNHLFQAATIQGEDIDSLYERYWKPLDTDWWREEVIQGRLRRPRLDLFLFHWLTMATGRDVVSHQLFPDFKRYLSTESGGAAAVLAGLAEYAPIYERFEKEPRESALGQFLYHLNILDVTTAYPALLWLLGPEGFEDDSERDGALDAIESWLVRRMLTRQTTKAYNAIFLTLLNSVREAVRGRSSWPLAKDVVDFMAGLNGESQFWPTDTMVESSLRALPAYQVFTRRRLRMLLEAIELKMRERYSESVSLPNDLTIEHVLPQQWEANWPLPPDGDPVQSRLDRDQAKHRLGNLTLVTGRLNPKMSNAAWDSKRAAIQRFSVMRMSSNIVASETWDEGAIRERGDRLVGVVLSIWPRAENAAEPTLVEPAGEISELPPAEVAAAAASQAAGPPDPQDPHGLARALGTAEEVGIGADLRRAIAAGRAMGLVTRPYRNGVAFATPDKHRWLFALEPQWDEGGSFAVWKWPSAFAQWVPGVSLDDAQAVLGSSEDKGLLMPPDIGLLLDKVQPLLPSAWAPPSFSEHVAQLAGARLLDLDRIPADVQQVIDQRAGPDPVLALRFADAAAQEDGVILRGQELKNIPWYFQVRHPKFKQVVAYVHPRPDQLYIEYRLPRTHETYGVAVARDGLYGIVLTLNGDAFEIAVRLLRDALSEPN